MMISWMIPISLFFLFVGVDDVPRVKGHDPTHERYGRPQESSHPQVTFGDMDRLAEDDDGGCRAKAQRDDPANVDLLFGFHC